MKETGGWLGAGVGNRWVAGVGNRWVAGAGVSNTWVAGLGSRFEAGGWCRQQVGGWGLVRGNKWVTFAWCRQHGNRWSHHRQLSSWVKPGTDGQTDGANHSLGLMVRLMEPLTVWD